MTMGIGVAVLAAGLASRMGRPKLLLPLGGKPLLAHVLEQINALSWADRIAVIGEPCEQLTALCRMYGIPSVYNALHGTGQSSSVRLAVASLDSTIDSILFVLGDQPLITKNLLCAMQDRYQRCGDHKAIIVPRHQQQLFSPVLFGSFWRERLSELSGDVGGRMLLRENPAHVIPVDWPDPAAFFDVDTWQEYEWLCREWNKQ